MIDSPFNSPVFKSTWKKYFAPSQSFENLKFLKPIDLVRIRKGRYVNVGKNISNGYGYSLDPNAEDYRRKVIVLYDVLPYLQPVAAMENQEVSVLRVRQHQGYLSRLNEGKNLDDFLLKRFSKGSRVKIRKYPKKLSESFETQVRFFDGQISREEYDPLFNTLIHLIGGRFGELGLENNILQKKEYYYDLIFGMVNAGKGVIQLITCDGEAAAIGFCFRSDRQLYYAITTFDTSLRKFNVGHVLIYNWLQWCYEHNIEVFDFSKGENEYKRRWANEEYQFENHILYDPANFLCIVEARVLCWFFQLKQFLRDYRVNRFYSKLKFHARHKGKTAQSPFQVLPVTEYGLTDYEIIQKGNRDYENLKGVVFDLLFPSSSRSSDLQLYRKKEGREYLLLGLETPYLITPV